MHNVERRVYYVLFLIVCSSILINCQGGGGGGHGGGGGGRSFSSRNNSNSNASKCVGTECLKHFLLTMVGVIGAGGSFFLCYWCYHKRNGRPKEDNSTFVNSEPSQDYTPVKSAFQTGMWSSRYYQHRSWHGPHQLHLSFNPHSMTVIGSGCDDVGEFEIDGVFSNRTQRMGLTKYYKPETGNAAENMGHYVFIQVAFKAELNQFEGKWYVQTKKYHGENEFVLKLDEFLA